MAPPPHEYDTPSQSTPAPASSGPQSSESTETGNEVLDAQSQSGGGNDYAQSLSGSPGGGPGGGGDAEGGGDETCATPMETFREAVESGDGEAALTAYACFGPDDMATLKGDAGLQHGFFGIIEPRPVAQVLFDLQHPQDQWLELAATYCSSDASVLVQVLNDVDVTGAEGLPEVANSLLALPAFVDAAVLDGVISMGDPAGQLVAFADDSCIELLRTAYAGNGPFYALPALEQESVGVFSAFLTSEAARIWLMEDPSALSSQIIEVWGTAGEWMRGIWIDHAGDFEVLVVTDAALWGPALFTELTAGSAGDLDALAPGTTLTDAVFAALLAYEGTAPVQVCSALGYELPIAVTMAFEQGWLTLDNLTALTTAYTLDEVAQAMADNAMVALLEPLGPPALVLPDLVAEEAQLVVAYGAGEGFRLWLAEDDAAFSSAITQPELWVEPMLLHGQVDVLLSLAEQQPDLWRTISDENYTKVLDALPKPCAETQVAGVFALYKEAGRSAAAGVATYHSVYGMELYSAADQPEFAEDDYKWTPAGGVEETWEWKTRVLSVDPHQETITEFVDKVSDIPRGQVATTPVAFGNSTQGFFKRKSPNPEPAFHTTDPETGTTYINDVGTSVYWGTGINLILMYTNDGGRIHEVDPGTGNSQWIGGDQDISGDGAAGGVGGQRRDAAGNLVNTTDEVLSYFENHAYHEVGHGVGNKQFTGMAAKGDDLAKTWSKWQDSSDGEMQAAYFTANGEVELEVSGVKTKVQAADIAAWLTHVLEHGTQPAAADPGGTVTALGGSTGDHWSAIGATAIANENLYKYINAIPSGWSGIADGAYEYPGFTPPGNTYYVFSSRDTGFIKYEKNAYDQLHTEFGWYSMASWKEMFAEIYTKHYATAAHSVPAAKNGVNWADFFRDLEASPDSALQAGVAPQPTGIGAPGAAAAAPAAAPAGPGPGGPVAGGRPPSRAVPQPMGF